MRLDTANRAFVMLLAAAVGGYLLIGVGACLLLCLLGYQVALDGWGALTRGDQDLRPAALFLGLVAAGTVFALWSLGHQLRASRRLARRIRTLTVEHPPPLGAALERAGLAGKVDLVDASEPFSFAYGVGAPRIALSRGLVDSVTPGELEAVLEHERYHVQNLDPLKVVLARALPRAFFYLPALGALRRRYVTARELAADRHALSACGRAPLAGALFKVVRGPDWP